jgi:hypothetical protein
MIFDVHVSRANYIFFIDAQYTNDRFRAVHVAIECCGHAQCTRDYP